jgi:hypothetical protein
MGPLFWIAVSDFQIDFWKVGTLPGTQSKASLSVNKEILS